MRLIVISNAKAFDKINTIKFRTDKAIRETWFSVGQDLKNEANEEIKRRPKSGRTYIIRSKGGRRRLQKRPCDVGNLWKRQRCRSDDKPGETNHRATSFSVF